MEEHEEQEVVVSWDEWDVPGPDTSKRDNLMVLAKMTWNSYMTPDDATWYDLGDGWPNVCSSSFNMLKLLIPVVEPPIRLGA